MTNNNYFSCEPHINNLPPSKRYSNKKSAKDGSKIVNRCSLALYIDIKALDRKYILNKKCRLIPKTHQGHQDIK